MLKAQTEQFTTSHRGCWRAARAPGDCSRRASITRGDESCEVELKNAWPATRARPDEKTP
jgi:hypothetical protein